jgi:hypothetical protein
MEHLRVADECSEYILVPSRARSELNDVFPIDTLLPRYLSEHLLARGLIERQKANKHLIADGLRAARRALEPRGQSVPTLRRDGVDPTSQVPVPGIEPSGNETSPLEVFQSLVDLPEIQHPEWTRLAFRRRP